MSFSLDGTIRTNLKKHIQKPKANVKTPMGHFGNNELEIGRVCVQLANPDFKYTTGETLTLEAWDWFKTLIINHS